MSSHTRSTPTHTGTVRTASEVLASRTSRPVYTRLETLGLLLIGITVLAVTALIVVTEPTLAGEVLAFFGPMAAVTVLAAWLAWRYGTWARAVGLVVGVAAAALLSWTVVALAAPDSVVDFGLGVGVAAGVLLAVGGGVAALLSGRRGALATAATPAERRIIKTTAVVLGVALAASGVLTLVGRSSVDPAEADGATRVAMGGFEFRPAEIRIDGPDARLVVHNTDAFLHDIAIPTLGVDAVRVTPGSTVAVDLAGAATGTYVVYCTLHSDLSADEPGEDDMTARLVVR